MLSLRKQWPFWVSGVFVGVAEVMNYIVLEKPIGLTTGLVEMTAAFEQTVAPAVDWWSRSYDPNVHWIIIGVILGAWLVSRSEKESRGWVKYTPKALWLGFFGGFFFSLGTRLAKGCTTHHFLGGIPAMSTASFFYLLAIIPAGFLTFYLMSKMGVGNVFKGQENKSTSEYGIKHGGKMALDGEACKASANYNPKRDWIRVSLVVFLFAFFANAVIGSFIHGTEDGIYGWGYAVSAIGWGLTIWLLLIGVIAGIGMAKTGFGTECAFMTPEISAGLKHNEKHGCNLFEKRWKISGSTRFMFRSMSPFTAIFIEILILWTAIVIGWQYFEIPLPLGMNPNWVLLLGAAMQGFGSVAMIGCEIRTYMRLGLGYMTAVVAFPGFLLGYLPYTLYQEWWEDLARDTMITKVKHLPNLFGRDPLIEAIIAILFGVLVAVLIFWSIKRGMRLTNSSFRDLMTKPNDELAINYFSKKVQK